MRKDKGIEIDSGALYFSTNISKIEVIVDCQETRKKRYGCYYNNHLTFNTLAKFLKSMGLYYETLIAAIDCGCNVKIVFSNADGEAVADFDEGGILRMHVKGMDEQMEKELKGCKEKLNKVKEIVG